VENEIWTLLARLHQPLAPRVAPRSPWGRCSSRPGTRGRRSGHWNGHDSLTELPDVAPEFRRFLQQQDVRTAEIGNPFARTIDETLYEAARDFRRFDTLNEEAGRNRDHQRDARRR
jgi:hypothetical protein